MSLYLDHTISELEVIAKRNSDISVQQAAPTIEQTQRLFYEVSMVAALLHRVCVQLRGHHEEDLMYKMEQNEKL